MNSSGMSDRPEALVVKIIRQPVRHERTRQVERARSFVGGEVANHHLKPIAAKVGWPIGMPQPSQVLERVRRVLDRNRRPVEDRQVLHRQRVPVFEAAIRNTTAGQIPAPADQVDGLKRAKVGFREFVERVASAAGRRYQRKLFAQ